MLEVYFDIQPSIQSMNVSCDIYLPWTPIDLRRCLSAWLWRLEWTPKSAKQFSCDKSAGRNTVKVVLMPTDIFMTLLCICGLFDMLKNMTTNKDPTSSMVVCMQSDRFSWVKHCHCQVTVIILAKNSLKSIKSPGQRSVPWELVFDSLLVGIVRSWEVT